MTRQVSKHRSGIGTIIKSGSEAATQYNFFTARLFCTFIGVLNATDSV